VKRLSAPDEEVVSPSSFNGGTPDTFKPAIADGYRYWLDGGIGIGIGIGIGGGGGGCGCWENTPPIPRKPSSPPPSNAKECPALLLPTETSSLSN
jgi:hypothetical protein